MTREMRGRVQTVLRYVVLIVVGMFMVYPLIWMVGASFMTNQQIFSGVGFIPKSPTLDGYIRGFAGYQGMNLLYFMFNTYKFVLPKVLFTVVSSTVTAYGFARFDFPGKKFSFAVLLSTLFLPQVVLNVPSTSFSTRWGGWIPICRSWSPRCWRQTPISSICRSSSCGASPGN